MLSACVSRQPVWTGVGQARVSKEVGYAGIQTGEKAGLESLRLESLDRLAGIDIYLYAAPFGGGFA